MLSGLRLDALTKHAGLKGWVDGEVAAQRVGSGMTCTLRTTTPSLSLPAWVALLTGVQPEVHGLLGNRFAGQAAGRGCGGEREAR